MSDVRDKNENTPLIVAIRNNEVETVKALLEQGADVNDRDLDGNTPLHIAMLHTRSTEIMEVLVKARPDLGVQNRSGQTPLHFIDEDTVFDNFKSLVDLGININGQDKFGATPLHFAVQEYRVDIVKLLCERGADVSLVDSYGHTPLDSVRTTMELDLKRGMNVDKCKQMIEILDPVQAIVSKLFEIRDLALKREELKHFPGLYGGINKIISQYNDHYFDKVVRRLTNAEREKLGVQANLCIRFLNLMNDCLSVNSLDSSVEKYMDHIPDSYVTLEDCITYTNTKVSGCYSVTDLMRMTELEFETIVQKQIEQTSVTNILLRDHYRANESDAVEVLIKMVKSDKDSLNLLYIVKVHRLIK